MAEDFADAKFLFGKAQRVPWNGKDCYVDQLDGSLSVETYIRSQKHGGCFSSNENLAIALQRKFGDEAVPDAEIFTPPPKQPKPAKKADPVFVYEHFPDGSIVQVKGSNLNREVNKAVTQLHEEEVDGNSVSVFLADGVSFVALVNDAGRKKNLGDRKIAFVHAASVHGKPLDLPEPDPAAPEKPKKRKSSEGERPSPPKKRKSKAAAPAVDAIPA